MMSDASFAPTSAPGSDAIAHPCTAVAGATAGEGTGQRALITGLHGFTGRYLARELEAAGYQVFGTALGSEPGAHGFSVDLTDSAALAQVVDTVQPDVVVHLAAIAFVAHADVEAMYRVNLIGTRNLLEALSALRKPPRAVLLASSANIYGNSSIEPIDEDVAPAPANDYAVSKLAMEYMARLWLDRLPIIFVRPFNYTGVGQADNFLLPKIVGHFRRNARMIELGNLDVARDFSDVRTVIAAYRRLLDVAPVGQTFNVCSGVAHSLMEVLAMVSEAAGYTIDVSVNPAFTRANEVKRLVGSNARLTAVIGPLPQIALSDTLRWMLRA
jgi:nucleoside-diphosphate-sugar epimerase